MGWSPARCQSTLFRAGEMLKTSWKLDVSIKTYSYIYIYKYLACNSIILFKTYNSTKTHQKPAESTIHPFQTSSCPPNIGRFLKRTLGPRPIGQRSLVSSEQVETRDFGGDPRDSPGRWLGDLKMWTSFSGWWFQPTAFNLFGSKPQNGDVMIENANLPLVGGWNGNLPQGLGWRNKLKPPPCHHLVFVWSFYLFCHSFSGGLSGV